MNGQSRFTMRITPADASALSYLHSVVLFLSVFRDDQDTNHVDNDDITHGGDDDDDRFWSSGK